MANNSELSEKEIEKFKLIEIIDKKYYTRKFYDLLFHKKLFILNENDNPSIGDDYFYLGIYYLSVDRNPELMEKYLLLAIGHNNLNAMCILGQYYIKTMNYELGKKYLLLAANSKYSMALNYLGKYYEITEHNFHKAESFYLSAIELGNTLAMDNLGNYYCNVGGPEYYDRAKKLYLQAIEQNYVLAINNLGYYYMIYEKNPDLMKKYYLMAISLGSISAIHNIGFYYKDFEKNYELASYYFTLLITISIDKFEYLYHYEIDDPKLKELVISKVFKIFYSNKFNICDFEYLLRIIFDYLNGVIVVSVNPNLIGGLIVENNLENLNDLLLYLGKIMFKNKNKDKKNEVDKEIEVDKKIEVDDKIKITGYDGYIRHKEQKMIINGLIDSPPIRIKKKCNETIEMIETNKASSEMNEKDGTNIKINENVIGMRELLKAKYIEYLDNKYKPGGDGYIRAKKDFESRLN
jgi:tetratricopeptide (TPR) repeat protein